MTLFEMHMAKKSSDLVAPNQGARPEPAPPTEAEMPAPPNEGDWRAWCRTLHESYGLTESQRKLITEAFDVGLVASYWKTFSNWAEQKKKVLEIAEGDYLVRVGCSRSALYKWPNRGAQLWLLLRVSIVLGIDLSKIKCPPIQLLLDAYVMAVQSLKNCAFRDVSARIYHNPDSLSGLVDRIDRVDVLTTLVTFRISNDDETLTDTCELLIRLAANVRRDLDAINGEVRTIAQRLNWPDHSTDLDHDERTRNLRKFFHPMLIVMSVMHYERWEEEIE